ncbi:hypothetical protein HID58_056304, partial [Brassica napus]
THLLSSLTIFTADVLHNIIKAVDGRGKVGGGDASGEEKVETYGNGRGQVLCGGEGGRAGRGAVMWIKSWKVMEELMAEEEELMASGACRCGYESCGCERSGRGTRGGERSTVIPSSGGRGSGGGEAYGGGEVYSGIVMEVVVVKEVVWWYKRKIPQWWLKR